MCTASKPQLFLSVYVYIHVQFHAIDRRRHNKCFITLVGVTFTTLHVNRGKLLLVILTKTVCWAHKILFSGGFIGWLGKCSLDIVLFINTKIVSFTPNCKIFRIKNERLRQVEKRFFTTQYMHLLILQLARLDSLKYSRISWTFFGALSIHESAVFEFGNS